MTSGSVRFAVGALFLVVALACGGGGGGGGGFNGIPAQLIPNLRPELPYDFSIENTDTGSATERVLRMATRVSNYGEGPMELFGEIQGAQTGQLVPAFQIVRWNNGDTTSIPAGDFEHHAEHGHWHWDNFARFTLAETANPDDPYDPANTAVGSNAKVSFCLVDTSKISLFGGQGQPNSAQYRFCNRNTQGISVGWSDTYSAGLPHQWIVIEGVADGSYWVIVEADPAAKLQELDETDNKSAVKIQISGNSVTVVP